MKELYEHSQFIMCRYDHYYDSVNNKGNYYITLNAFLIGAVFTIYTTFKDEQFVSAHCWVIYIMAASLLMGLVSIIYTFCAVNPFLKSGNKNKYKSLIFFGSVAEYEEASFIKKFESQSKSDVESDMTKQLHQLATGLTGKYKKLTNAALALRLEFVLITVLTIIIILNKI